MKRNYDVIIIGAGVIGLSTAYYLAKRKSSRILVLEKEENWVSGSSALANGGFRQQFSTPLNIRMSQLSVPVFENFEEEFGIDIALRQYGYLFLTATDWGQAALVENIRLQRGFGVPVEWLDKDRLDRAFPFLRTSDLAGGAFCGKDGFVDPYSIASGFGTAARRLGVEVLLGEPVTDILRSSGSVSGVRTSRGSYGSRSVLNAAGPSAASVAAMAGIALPVEPVRRMLIMTEPFPDLPENIPMIVDIDSGFFARKESGRVLMGWSDPSEPPGFNLSFDPSIVEIVAEKAVKRIPGLERVEVNTRKSWAGLYAVTPDHHCVLGETPVKGFFLANGFSGHGMMHSPAVGMILADLILDGKTDRIDVHPFRYSRFEEGDVIEEKVVI